VTLTTENVVYRDGDAVLHGLLLFDGARTDRRPGVLVVHGGAGLDDHARGRARRFAESGFIVFACDMYGEGVHGNRERVIQLIGEIRRNRTTLRQRAQPAMDILGAHPLVDGRLGAVGYCFGGMAVLELARSGADLAGVVSVHGSLEASVPAEPGTITAKILVCHGALDPHVPMTQVTGFADEMTRAGVDWQLFIYGSAMHGFTHETATGQQPGVLYHALTDSRSSRAIQAFFDEIFATKTQG
jgi:dienelactone hydrolase